MGFLKKLFGSQKEEGMERGENQFKKLGEVDKCPYCKKKLEKIPQRKKKCEFCGNFMYSRTRPLDNKKVLLTEDQAKEIEIEWQIVNGTRDEIIKGEKEFKNSKEILRKRFGKEPSENDVKWAILNNKLLEHITKRELGLYRNIKLDMAEFLRKENNLKDSLLTYLEICYLDLNGPSNSGYFSLDLAFLAHGIIERIQGLIKSLKLNERETEKLFFQRCKLIENNMKLPLDTKKGWLELREELFIKKDPLVFEDIRFWKKKMVKKVRWVASWGERTCSQCKKLDGKTFDIDNVPKRPHKDCRCAIIKIK